jgi:CHAT domain-containing protein/tetratricopeptide (TPR) repeat protein
MTEAACGLARRFDMRTIAIIWSLFIAGIVLADEPKFPTLTEDEQKLDSQAKTLANEGARLYQQGKALDALTKFQQALEIRQKLYTGPNYPNGHPYLAATIGWMGAAHKAAGSPDKAMPFMEQALAMYRKLYPKSEYPNGQADLARSLNNVGLLFDVMGAYEKAIPFFDDALAMNHGLYREKPNADRLSDVAANLNNLAFTLSNQGAYEKSLLLHEEALKMRRQVRPQMKPPRGEFDVAMSLNNVASLQIKIGEFDKSQTNYEQAIELLERAFPDGHPYLATTYANQSSLLLALGTHDRALQSAERAVTMGRKLFPAARYPDGHPQLATILSNLASVLRGQQQYAKARGYYEDALTMLRKFYKETSYPDGHRELAVCLVNMGSIQQLLGEWDQARDYFRQGLDMRRKLYPAAIFPDGHTELANCLNNLGVLLRDRGEYAEALPYFQDALAMRRKLYPAAKYPDGEFDFSINLQNVAVTLAYLQKGDQALPLFAEALAMRGKLSRRQLLTASEADALSFLQVQVPALDWYLTTSQGSSIPAPVAYQSIWDTKAAVTRVLERRHEASRTASNAVQAKTTRVREIRRRVEQLLQDSRLKPEERDHLLADLQDERDRLERELAKDLPKLAQWAERDQLTVKDLAAILPAQSVFIDFVAFTHFEIDEKAKGKAGLKALPAYVAFVISPGKEGNVSRVELGDAKPIDEAIHAWRQAIAQREASPAANTLRETIWDKLAKFIPTDTKTLYLSPVGDLARLPWAALPAIAVSAKEEGPGRKEPRVLLTEYAIALVPHASFLLEQLRFPPAYSGPESALAMGDLDYGRKLPPLPAAAKEIDSFVILAPGPVVSLTKGNATAAKLTEALPKTRFAHLATHGEFQADELAAEKKREAEARALWQEGLGQGLRRVGGKNPLGFVSLALADDEVLTGLRIVDLQLENLKLVTLSACETGLGEYTGGEGVQGLQRAFHLAGCPNVIASLWNVNDAATAALMAKFYNELWVNKKPPIEALREAQLTIYHHPELIPDLAGERGAPRLKEAVAVKDSGRAKPQVAGRADTKLWAAFLLSGVGK